jgi:hypothetical protein
VTARGPPHHCSSWTVVQHNCPPCAGHYIDSRGETATGEISYLINGAYLDGTHQRAVELSESLTVDSDVVKRLLDWADEHGKVFRTGGCRSIHHNEPAWWRCAYPFDQAYIDEAIRWAVGRFNEIAPQETVTTLTLSSDGRDDPVSTITEMLRITRVWWPYTASSPATPSRQFPPQWVSYEIWGSVLSESEGTGPSATLYIKASTEHQSSDSVRVWYQRLCTLNGLDGASDTTIPDDAELVPTQEGTLLPHCPRRRRLCRRGAHHGETRLPCPLQVP